MAPVHTSAFDEHQQWLKGMRDAFAVHQSTFGGSPSTHLPTAPVSWPEERAAMPSGFHDSFAGMALQDSDFDEPVYRSLSGLMADEFDEPVYRGLEVDGDEPVYRGLSDVAHFEPDNVENAAENAWLESMPPLICRQRAYGASQVA